MFEIYKKGQGNTARWIAAGSLLALAALGTYELEDSASGWSWAGGQTLLSVPVSLVIAGMVFVICAVLTGLVVNWPRFVDYLIMSEAELRKVSWPTRGELERQTTVVIITILFFSLVLLVADVLFGFGAGRIYGF